MGLLEEAAAAIIKEKVSEALAPAAYAAGRKIRQAADDSYEKDRKSGDKFAEKVQNLQNKKTEKVFLFLKKKPFTWTDKYEVFGPNNELRYTVRGKATSIKRHLFVYDQNGNELGSLKENLLSLRSPISLEALVATKNPFDCDIVISGGFSAHLSSEHGITKRQYHLDPPGWLVEGNLLGGNLRVSDRQEHEILSMPVVNHMRQFYAISIDPEYELLGLLITLAVNVDFEASKSTQLSSAVQHMKNERKRELRRMWYGNPYSDDKEK